MILVFAKLKSTQFTVSIKIILNKLKMRITIISIGKFSKNSSNYDLFKNYQKRLPWRVDLKELDLKGNFQGNILKDKEADLLLGAIPLSSKIIALDEAGKMLGSLEFADKIKNYGNSGNSNLAFVIGGADGLSQKVKNKADLVLSFSKMTFPHLMIRSFLMEQIYRACTIINNHPYHRR
jgi:23S rRNA (pseudouridine1915-N3)-methyltransferase